MNVHMLQDHKNFKILKLAKATIGTAQKQKGTLGVLLGMLLGARVLAMAMAWY